MRELRGEGRRGEMKVYPCVTWIPRKHLTVILISFDHFNGLSHGID